MGFGDKLKDLRKQAEVAVAEHKDKIQSVVENAGAVANDRTGGKYATKIMKVGEKATAAVDKIVAEHPEAAEATAPPAQPAEPTEPSVFTPPTTPTTPTAPPEFDE
jgi:MT0933-like antitoxin protein